MAQHNSSLLMLLFNTLHFHWNSGPSTFSYYQEPFVRKENNLCFTAISWVIIENERMHRLSLTQSHTVTEMTTLHCFYHLQVVFGGKTPFVSRCKTEINTSFCHIPTYCFLACFSGCLPHNMNTFSFAGH